MSDVLVGCGIVREAKHTSAWISQNVNSALYPSLGEVPSGNSSVSFFRIFVYAPYSISVLTWVIFGTKIRTKILGTDFCTRKLSQIWCSLVFPKTRNSENQTQANLTDTPPTPTGRHARRPQREGYLQGALGAHVRAFSLCQNRLRIALHT